VTQFTRSRRKRPESIRGQHDCCLRVCNCHKRMKTT